MVILPSVNVPVLSLQITEALPKVSTAANLPRAVGRRELGGRFKQRGNSNKKDVFKKRGQQQNVWKP